MDKQNTINIYAGVDDILHTNCYKYFIRFLKLKNAYVLYFNNLKKDAGGKRKAILFLKMFFREHVTNSEHILNASFYWSSTPEGTSFWRDLSITYKKTFIGTNIINKNLHEALRKSSF